MDAKFLATTTEAAANLIRKAKLSQSTFDVDGFLSRCVDRHGMANAQCESQTRA